ncbi:putative protein dml1 protein [Erysiphe necator]|uniref:Tubulin nucleotide-binding domain-like protein n=1 Tax=Uncinula necator TaxID=52586 RepID=A0A0B1P1S8_UNCNE|nr:putative protein dml1 protein [Erysiphe necator]
MHEIVSLQFGQRSNYLATHFWNTLESYFTYTDEEESIVDHDIHFRPGIGIQNTETFTPRTVIYDLKGGFGSLRKINALYDTEEPDLSELLWDKPAVIQRLESVEKCAYQQSLEQNEQPKLLDSDTVKYWSDYSRVYFHPKSVVKLNEYEIGSTSWPFESWDEGEALFKSVDKEHDLVERDLRPFIEEADHMQAFQVFSSTDDAWGSFAAQYLQQIKDEYAKTDVLFWGLEEDIVIKSREKRFTSSNIAKSISVIAPESTLFIPLTLPSKGLPSYITLERNSDWHVSALMSIAVESITLLSRLRQRNQYRETLDQLVCLINTNGHQNIAKLRMSIEQPSSHNNDVPEIAKISEQNRNDRSLRNKKSIHNFCSKIGPNAEIFDIDFFPIEIGEQVNRRPMRKLQVFSQYEIHRQNLCSWNQNISNDRYDERFQTLGDGLPVVLKRNLPLGFPLLDSFPRIFNEASTSSSLAVRTSLTVDSSIASRLKALKNIVNRAFAVDEREAFSNSLGELAEGYEEGWDSGSDEDED